MKFKTIKFMQRIGPLSAVVFLCFAFRPGTGACGNSRMNETTLSSPVTSLWSDGDEFWDSRFESQGMNGKVIALAKDGTYLYSGGRFTRAGGTAVNHVARWNGMRWESMGGGVTGIGNPYVAAIVCQGGRTYIGGSFSFTGGSAANNISFWNGQAWTSLGSGTNGSVTSMVFWNNSLFIAGGFTSAGGISVKNIARWDGTAWHDVGGGTSGTVFSLTVWNNKLIAAGQFSQAGSTPVLNIAAWNGSSWSALGNGLNNSVYTTGSGNDLYAGGKFTASGSTALNRIARWNGTSWFPLGSGLNNYPLAMAVQDDDVFAGGTFDQAGGNPAAHIARWNISDQDWSRMGSGTWGGSFPFVEALLTWGTAVYAGGGFTNAGSGVSYYIGLWRLVTNYRGFTQYSLWDLRQGDMAVVKAASVGCAWGDYDNDGDWDLFVANENGQNNLLYRNQGSGKYIQILNSAITTDGGNSQGGTWGDYDNDGFLDLFVPNLGGPDELYHNKGDGSFTRINAGEIATASKNSTAAAWADYDNDGFLDLMVIHMNEPNTLFHNEGNGTFSKVTTGPIAQDLGASTGLGWSDYDLDGDPDLVVVNTQFQENFFYKNKGGEFVRDLESLFSADAAEAMGCSWGDYNRDGYSDLFIATSGQTDLLYRNLGNGLFEKELNESPVLREERSRGSGWGDFNKDGSLDLFVSRKGTDQNSIYLNMNALYLEEYYLPDFDARGGAWCDHDGDGEQELFITSYNQQNLLFDYTGNKNRWLQIQCRGTVSNTWGIGAKVWVITDFEGEWIRQFREISSQTGGGGQNSLAACFGLGMDEAADSVRIEWPSGIVWDTTQVACNQILTIREPSPVIIRHPPLARPDTLIITSRNPVEIHPLDNDNDPEGGEMFLTGIDTSGTAGNISLVDVTIIQYTPSGDAHITQDQFDYMITDEQLLTDTSRIILFYDIIQYPPHAFPDTLVITSREPVEIHPLDNDNDPEGGEMILTGIDTSGIAGNISLVDETIILYTPSGDTSLTQDQFEYIITNEQALSDTARIIVVYEISTSVAVDHSTHPERFRLYDNVPNPFNPVTLIRFDVPDRSQVRLDILNMLGQCVSTPVNQVLSAGEHRITWDGKDHHQNPLPAGVYLYCLRADAFYAVKKMAYIR